MPALFLIDALQSRKFDSEHAAWITGHGVGFGLSFIKRTRRKQHLLQQLQAAASGGKKIGREQSSGGKHLKVFETSLASSYASYIIAFPRCSPSFIERTRRKQHLLQQLQAAASGGKKIGREQSSGGKHLKVFETSLASSYASYIIAFPRCSPSFIERTRRKQHLLQQLQAAASGGKKIGREQSSGGKHLKVFETSLASSYASYIIAFPRCSPSFIERTQRKQHLLQQLQAAASGEKKIGRESTTNQRAVIREESSGISSWTRHYPGSVATVAQLNLRLIRRVYPRRNF
ncbi:uncharacterized protein LOC128735252 [Sabethes cyaneus]|uniref:uncharacterized protein LOC128735252 n=1 Tax=Sabethes cyaneus TaxID=53552 RepID=UPI00237D37CD|nr:uncharacterized protein LOC128735252 [Sabethes cyaneus]